MDCLKGKISYRYCADDVAGVYYVNDLPGISTLLLNDLTTVESQTFDKVFKSIETRVLRQFKSRVERAISEQAVTTYQLYKSPAYSLKNVYERTPIVFDTITAPVNQAFIVPTSQYTSARFNSVSFFANANFPNAVIKIIDTLAGATIKTVTHNVTIGYNKVDLEAFSPDNSLQENFYAVQLVANGLGLVQYYMNDIYDCGCNNELFTYPASLPDYYSMDAEYEQYLAVDFEYICDIEKYICANQSTFLTGLWYQFGAEILNEALNSDNVTWAIIGKEQQKIDNRAELEEKATREISASIKKIPFNSLCADCFGVNNNLSVVSIKQ